MSPQGSCPWSPKRDTRGCHQLSHHQPRWDGCWSCLQLCHDHQQCSQGKFREPGATQAAPGQCHPCSQRGGMAALAVGCTVPVATSKVSPHSLWGEVTSVWSRWSHLATVSDQGSPMGSGTSTQHIPPGEGKPLPKH